MVADFRSSWLWIQQPGSEKIAENSRLKAVRNAREKVLTSPNCPCGIPNWVIFGRHLQCRWRCISCKMLHLSWISTFQVKWSILLEIHRHRHWRWRPNIARFLFWNLLRSPKGRCGLVVTFMWPFLTALYCFSIGSLSQKNFNFLERPP